MATYIQQYNPWRENLAVNVLSGIINHIQENERNKKANAFLEQLTQNLSANRQGNLLTPQNEPEGYNSSPWAQAFHQNNNPLTQFDFGTNGLVPQKPFSMAEILNEATKLRSSPRFASMNPQTVDQLVTPYLKQAETDRLLGLRSQFADIFSNAGNFDDQVKALTLANIMGAVDNDVVKNYAQFRPHDYQFSTVNAGNNIYSMRNNPNTGESTTDYVFPVGPTPDTVLREETKRTKNQNDYENTLFERDNPTLHWETDVNGNKVGINPRTGKVTEIKMPNGETLKVDKKGNFIIKVDDNGNYVLFDQNTGTAFNPTYSDGSNVRAAPSSGELTARRKFYEDKLKAMNKELESLISSQGISDNPEFFQQQIDDLRRRIQETEQESARVLQIQPQQQIQPQTIPTSSDVRIPENVSSLAQSIQRASMNVKPNTPQIAAPIVSGNPFSMMMGNNMIGADVSPDIPQVVSQDVRTPQQQAQSQPQQQQQAQSRRASRNADVEIPNEMLYVQSRDKDIQGLTVMSLKNLEKFINEDLLRDSRFSGMTPTQVLYYLYKIGIRIKD